MVPGTPPADLSLPIPAHVEAEAGRAAGFRAPQLYDLDPRHEVQHRTGGKPEESVDLFTVTLP